MHALWKKSYDKPRLRIKSREVFANKIRIVKAMVFSSGHVQMWKWDHKKAENWKFDAFELWCCRRLSRVPWTRRSNQSLLKEVNPECSLEGLMLKLKFQYFGHLTWRANLLEKTLMLGQKEKGGTEWDGWMPSLTQWTWVWANSGRWWRIRKPGVL